LFPVKIAEEITLQQTVDENGKQDNLAHISSLSATTAFMYPTMHPLQPFWYPSRQILSIKCFGVYLGEGVFGCLVWGFLLLLMKNVGQD